MADTGSLLSSGSSVSLSNADANRINRLFDNPEENYSDIASYMRELYKKNGSINSVIRYLQSHLTYNYNIYPVANSKNNFDIGTDITEYASVASELSLYNIKYYAPYFVKKVMQNGVAFFYEIKDSNGVAYMEFPTSWGRVYEINNNSLRWELNMSNFDANHTGLPNEIQKALEQYLAGNFSNEDKWTDEEWFKLSDKGVAFALDPEVLNSGVQVSEFASMILDSLNLDKAKKNVEIMDTIDAVRLLHSEIPTDKEGKPLMNSKTARVYDRQFKNSLPKGIAGITSPMKITNVPLNGAGNSSSQDMVKRMQEQLFVGAGITSNIFGEKTNSSNIVNASIQKDANWLYTAILPMLENYYNSKLSKFKTNSGMKWKTKFVRQSYFTIKDDIARAEKQATLGGSRLDFLSASGLEPIEIYSKLIMEQQMLDIDSIMIPKQTSHTLSGSGAVSGNETGRPNAEEPTDDTVRIQDNA